MSELLPLFHWTNLLIIPGLLIGYTVHELAHAFTAYYLGDYSQIERGKITLNPFRHISWFGSFSFLLFGVGWSNPIEMNPQNFKNKPVSICIIAIAGPIASFTFFLFAVLVTLIIAAAVVYQSGASTDEIFTLLFPPSTEALPDNLDLQALTIAFTSKVAIASFWLAAISLLPLPGLDGFTLLTGLNVYFKSKKAKSTPLQQAVPVAGSTTEAIPANTHTRMIPVDQISRRNNVSDIHFKLGAEYHEAKKYDDAIVRYRQAIANDQNFGPAYVNLGLAYLGKGKRREAIHAFRGATQFADDQKSQQEAWYQLHQLSEVSYVDDTAEEELTEMGATPWTDTTPSPDWVKLTLSASLFVLAGIFLYSYLINSLVEMFTA